MRRLKMAGYLMLACFTLIIGLMDRKLEQVQPFTCRSLCAPSRLTIRSQPSPLPTPQDSEVLHADQSLNRVEATAARQPQPSGMGEGESFIGHVDGHSKPGWSRLGGKTNAHANVLSAHHTAAARISTHGLCV